MSNTGHPHTQTAYIPFRIYCEYWSYVASWLDMNPKRINVKFSCQKFGDKMAWELACIARDKELRDREQILKIYERRQASRKAKRRSKQSASRNTRLK